MPSVLSRLGCAAAVATILGASTRAFAQCTLDPNVGTNLGLTDDSVSPAQPLGFTFPFAGALYDTVYVSSNGFVYLYDSTGSVPPPTSSLCCNGNVTTMLAAANPMVCAQWMDLNPSTGGSVHFNAVSPTKALITWMAVPEYAQTNLVTVQLTLKSTGEIDIYGDVANTNATHTALVGWSPGSGALDPGASNLSSLPFPTSSATVYELFLANTYDLAGIPLAGVPTGATSWVVAAPSGCASTGASGLGCPKPCDTFEVFPSSAFDMSTSALLFTRQADGSYLVSQCTSACFDTSFTNNLALRDDTLAVAQSLGFTFPYCGGSTTAIDVCSNGFVWLVSGSSTSADFSPTREEFLQNPARIAATWMDLNPSVAGGVYFDALPGKAIVTWDQVPAFGAGGTSNTLQLQLFPSGNFILAWPSVLNNATTGNGIAITGFTQGAAPAANEIDFTASIPFQTGNGTPLALANQAGSRPIIGTNFTLEASHVRTGTVAGSLTIGATNPNLDLTFLGLIGCRLLASLDVSLPIAVSSPITTVTLPIPNVNALVGRSLNTQAVMVDPGLGRAIPVYLSNGAVLTFGH